MALKQHNIALAVFMALLFLVLWRDSVVQTAQPLLDSAQPYLERARFRSSAKNSVQNSTLGFQKIFYLSLPERQDRRQPLLAAARASDINITLFDAVRGVDVPVDERPPPYLDETNSEHSSGKLGCLMSHMRAMKTMIKENIATALIVESDVDWDVRIKDSMPLLAEGVQQISNLPALAPPRHARDVSSFKAPSSPYGDNWDMLWLGHCGAYPGKGSGRIYTYHDPTVPRREKEFAFGGQPTGEQHPFNETRLVYENAEAVCSYGVAVSLKGAIKIVDWLSRADSPVDIEYIKACTSNPNISCVGVYPSLFGSWASASNIEPQEGDSTDLQLEEHVVGPHTLQIPKGFSLGVRYSARKNTPLVMSGLGQETWIEEG
ncbi:MAG: hypothetical protein M1819_000888 [Sarea resinae]|nr:MAG: hypothetical protein M1819_000888 [Sarea resinae]